MALRSRAAEAKNHIGEVQTVCGKVASTHYASGSKGQPTSKLIVILGVLHDNRIGLLSDTTFSNPFLSLIGSHGEHDCPRLLQQMPKVEVFRRLVLPCMSSCFILFGFNRAGWFLVRSELVPPKRNSYDVIAARTSQSR
ncbi:MAG: hypothetical protein WCC03_02920 [Candidatus Acidiferrales bacterium]